MKLSAAILFATANAQRDRNREADAGNDAAAYDSYNAGFGGDDAYGGFYDAFADAFGDVGNYGDYNYDDATAAPAVEDAGRPVEVVAENDDAVKTVLIDGLALAASDPANASFNQNCWVATGNTADAWFTAGTNNKWTQCNGGEFQACEIKVTRNSANAIIQVVSKCANQQSCVDNMKQNFNPSKTSSQPVYATYAQQSCRPQNIGSINTANFGKRFKQSDSVCFFCVEPCSDDAAMDGTTGTAALLKAANCVGIGQAAEKNSQPLSGSTLDLLAATDAGVNVNVLVPNVDGVNFDSTASDFKTMNWYSTTSVNLAKDGNLDTRVVSRIQHVQLKNVNNAAVSPFPPAR